MESIARPTEGPPAEGSAGRPKSWIGWSLIAGCVLAVPAGWFLAYLAALPGFLGLFFYLLLGLMVGAAMYRFGRLAAPAGRPVLWVIGTLAALTVWGISLRGEYQVLPADADDSVRKSIQMTLTAQERQLLRERTHAHVAQFLRERYPPGGFAGYLRWMATDGRMECPRVVNETIHVFQPLYVRSRWLIRVGLALLLLEWTVMSQVLGLAVDPAALKASDQEDGAGQEASRG